MITIDGSAGEGGGQILRTALGLSLVTGKPFTIEKIRAGRAKPGLLRQHLTAVEAAAAIGRARVEGAELRSKRLTFVPGEVAPGSWRFAVGTAGSASLVLQAVLPPLLLASGTSRLILEGGTHNPFAPPFDFLERAFLPILGRMGVRVAATLETPGFYPAGGGRLRVEIVPGALGRIDILERGAVRRRRARAIVSGLPRSIGEREVQTIEDRLGCDEREVEEVRDPRGPGNVVLVEIESEGITEVFTAFGERGTPAETVAERAVDEARAYLAAEVPVGEHLADQLLIPFALAGGGAFLTMRPTSHARTNAEIIGLFLDTGVAFEEVRKDAWRVTVS